MRPQRRASRFSQRPTLLLVTGDRDSDRKGLAKEIEARLFAAGRNVYFLGMANMLYGVDADIDRSVTNRHEHFRRLGEIANLMIDAGMILVVSAAELRQEDLDTVRVSVPAERIATVWVGAAVTTRRGVRPRGARMRSTKLEPTRPSRRCCRSEECCSAHGSRGAIARRACCPMSSRLPSRRERSSTGGVPVTWTSRPRQTAARCRSQTARRTRSSWPASRRCCPRCRSSARRRTFPRRPSGPRGRSSGWSTPWTARASIWPGFRTTR